MFFFYSVTDVISNLGQDNTSVKIYLSKSKITDFKNYLKITKYTKKLLNYSNVSKCNSLLYTSVCVCVCVVSWVFSLLCIVTTLWVCLCIFACASVLSCVSCRWVGAQLIGALIPLGL